MLTFFLKYDIINQKTLEDTMITFVCGVPCAGKTTFINKNFPEVEKINIFDYQEDCFLLQHYLNAQEKAKSDLLKVALNNDVVMEHTLLKRKRRIEQIEYLRNGGYEGEIHLIFLNPPITILEKRIMERHKTKSSLNFLKNHTDIVELPTEDEGFTSITILENEYE
jgi:predicted kinase